MARRLTNPGEEDGLDRDQRIHLRLFAWRQRHKAVYDAMRMQWLPEGSTRVPAAMMPRVRALSAEVDARLEADPEYALEWC